MTYLFPDALIIQFAKAPVPGEVKTRMQPHLNPKQCAQLQRSLIRSTCRTVVEASIAPVELWVMGKDPENFFQSLCREVPGISLVKQQGRDLGERMHQAFEEALGRANPVLLIGSDCPFFTESYLKAAMEHLIQGHNAVLGPAADGGYVMIGLCKADALIFHDIDWGTDKVLAQTRVRQEQLAWSWAEMPILSDIDEPKDLSKLENLNII